MFEKLPVKRRGENMRKKKSRTPFYEVRPNMRKHREVAGAKTLLPAKRRQAAWPTAPPASPASRAGLPDLPPPAAVRFSKPATANPNSTRGAKG